jgi:hypothetical protein
MGGEAVRRLGSQAVRRLARRCTRRATLVGAGVLLAAYPANRLSAQVGHPPDQSPYRDFKRGRTLILTGGYVTGGQGALGVGPSDGSIASLRFEVPFGKPLAFFVGGAYGQMSRLVADPKKDSAAHFSGPVHTNVGLIEGGAQLRLSGTKTWHGLAPVIGISGGVIFASDPAADTSGYRFRAKGTFGPEFELHWYLGRRLAIRTNARLMFWQLTYPLAYKQPSPDGSRVQQIGAADKEWTRHPWISVGLGWTF